MMQSLLPSAHERAELWRHIQNNSTTARTLWRHIHENPEIGYQEQLASTLIGDWLCDHGFTVSRGVADMPTAFLAECGHDGARVVFLAEYDALPGVGHVCGHSLSGVASALAGVALAATVSPGRVCVLGTPAEEAVVPDAGGKIKCIKAGLLHGADAVLMAHAGNAALLKTAILARQVLNLEWFGVAAHAGAAPHKGRNALNAALLALNGINALYQQLEPGTRINAIMTNGGKLVNTIPDYAAVSVQLRAPTRERLDELVRRVSSCAAAGSEATGCRHAVSVPSPAVADFLHNGPLLDVYQAALESVGETCVREDPVCLSTDAGNASYEAPAIHPLFTVACPEGVELHAQAFATACTTDAAWDHTLRAAFALAATGCMTLGSAALREAAHTAHATALGQNPTTGCCKYCA